MINKLKEKINSLIGTTSGYRGIIFINLSVLALILVLMFVQYNWISKEKRTLKTIIDSHSKDVKTRQAGLFKTTKERKKEAADIVKPVTELSKFYEGRQITKQNVRNAIKKADMYFDYQQYRKAAGVYDRLINSRIVIDESDRIQNCLAECYYKMGEYENALGLYRNVSNNYLNSQYRLRSQLGHGKCLILTGDYGEARRVLYSIAGQEARYKDEEDRNIVIEAHYKIADSYIEQAKHYLNREEARQNKVAVR